MTATDPSQFSFNNLLADWLADRMTTPQIQPILEQRWLSYPWRTDAQPIANSPKPIGAVAQTIQAQLDQFRSLAPKLHSFCQDSLGWQTFPLDLMWDLWLPLANRLVSWQRAVGHPLIQGLIGGQGTGKTTLAQILSYILEQQGLQVCRLSIDDLYKTYADRQQLQQTDPRFRWRGPPGTHDVSLGLTVLEQLRQGNASVPIAIPRFDKSLHHGAGDRIDPEWITGADIVLFEGWFVGVRPIDPIAFETAPPPICSEADRAFAREVNTRLQAYLPLWEKLDRLILLYPVDYRFSQQWRQQAEQNMIASGKSGMSDAEIREFVEYFWKSLHPELFIAPMRHQSNQVDLVIEINADHDLDRIYCPAA
ncbi:glycerate kinase [Egbenema bharatensis]|uniref:glycerate kinase n=1 Tax=Egbenema bharatensis TaxID=3463334 RepID=UPI003A864524